jgi:fructan beta-fructosidase
MGPSLPPSRASRFPEFRRCFLLTLSLLPLLPACPRAQGADIPLADFEGADYAGWTASGAAFGSAPAHGTLPNQQAVGGFQGQGLANSYLGGDAAQGALESPVFTLQRDYLDFLIGGGSHPDQTAVELIVDGKAVLSASGNETENLFRTAWNVKPWAGKTARIRITDKGAGGWAHILADQFAQTSRYRAYQESYRPQFHFTAPKNWLNDPNGLVYYQGEYHLFYQSNPYGIAWGHMTWGHAVSPDLVHWEHLPDAILPDNDACTAYSGSAVVDWENTAGFQKGGEKTLIILWTSIGCGQRLAYSNDNGRTWTKWEGNPVVPQEGDARDPKVFWHAPTHKWVMALWTPANGGGIAFYTSPNLKQWTYASLTPGLFECPNIWQAALDGDPVKAKWILHGADGQYRIGNFDGTKFTTEAGPYPLDWGRNWYASQIYSDIPAADGRVLNISWMNGGSFPGMPFNQQMSFPVSLSLKTFPQGPRLAKLPAKEIENIRIHSDTWKDLTLNPGQNPLSGLSGDLFDVRGEFELAGAAEFGFRLRDSAVAYQVASKTLRVLGKSAPLEPVNNRITLRVLLDRASLEAYGNEGEVSLTGNFLPAAGRTGLEVYAVGGPVKIISLEAHKMRGTWDPGDLQAAWDKARQAATSVRGNAKETPGKPGPAIGRDGRRGTMGRNILGRLRGRPSGPLSGRPGIGAKE